MGLSGKNRFKKKGDVQIIIMAQMNGWEKLSRIVIGIMGFLLFWYDMLGYINISFIQWGNWVLMIGGVYLLITGVSGIEPLYAVFEKK